MKITVFNKIEQNIDILYTYITTIYSIVCLKFNLDWFKSGFSSVLGINLIFAHTHDFCCGSALCLSFCSLFYKMSRHTTNKSFHKREIKMIICNRNASKAFGSNLAGF